MSKKLTILFAPLSSFGHVNASVGIAQVLKNRGHRVVFAIDKEWKGYLDNEGFDGEFHSDSTNDLLFWPKFIKQYASFMRLPPLSQAEVFETPSMNVMLNSQINIEDQHQDIIKRVKPDIIVIDSYICSPVLTNSGPWVWLSSAAPLFGIPDSRTPPAFSGFAITSPKEEWEQFRSEYEKIMKPFHEKVNQWVISKGAPPIPRYMYHPHSPYLNMYMYPEELDYLDHRPLPPKFYRFDNFMRISHQKFEIPEFLNNKIGKLIFVSMGSFGSGDLTLMIRLVNIMKEIPHRFIISMGNFLEKTQLGDNMWGEPMVPQVSVLPLVDIVITHGGNNTVTETFYFGKPMIVMPLFGDQFDNAQRIDETSYGKRLNPFTFTRDELSNSIEKILNDNELYKRLDIISKRIQSSNSKERAADLIEQIIN